ncbi:hypothetical protein BASA81_009786 [Batrachochytrium salamandrivorans]|nr:hypothetical protein BASA81_009786 [Batrachochytrium salamandrivorans]
MPGVTLAVVCLLLVIVATVVSSSADFFTITPVLRRSLASSTCVPHNFSASSVNVQLWGWQGWYVLVDIFFLFFVLFFELVPIEFAMVASVLMICAAQIITIPDMTAGFANAGVLAVVCLFVLAEALTATGAIDYFLGKLLGNPKTLGQALIRMMVPCAFVAAWISSTAVVALMIPIVLRWSRKINQPPSLLMMPMCYAVHLGGTVTLVGTTTNLVISGLYNTYYCTTMGIFELSTVGLPVAIAGVGALLLLSPKVLPSAEEYQRRTSRSYAANTQSSAVRRCFRRYCSRAGFVQEIMPTYSTEFTFDALVPVLFAGKSIEEAKLRNLDDLFLTTVTRGGQSFHAVGPEFLLAEGDRVSFAGQADDFLLFCEDRGLVPVPEGALEESGDNEGGSSGSSLAKPLVNSTLEAVVRHGSDLEGKSMSQVHFRSKYLASALAIYRTGEKVNAPGSKLGQITLKVGDVLLLVASDQFSWDAEETRRDLKPRFHLPFDARALVDRKGSGQLEPREYTFSMKVSANRRLLGVRLLGGLTIEQAALRSIPGITVVAVTRDDVTEKAVGPDFVLRAGDVLWFSGDKDGLPSLRRVPGLEDTDAQQVQQLGVETKYRRLVEVVVSLNSNLLYKTVKESRFRTRFQAAIVAVQRRDHRVLAKIGDIELQPGDVLILEAGPDFTKRFARDDNFLIMSEVDHSTPPRMDRFYIAVFAAIAMIVCTAATGMDLLLFALFACGIVLAFGVLTRERAHKAIDWKIIITVAAAFGLSTAMTNTKVANVIGYAITELAISTNTGEIGVLAVVMIFTEILCALITAKAGALLMFPIAADAAYRLGINPATMAIALMLGSSDYTTPQGHQTNLMVLSPGAYKFVDYQKLGIPLEIYLNVVQLLCLAYIGYWYVCTVIAVCVLALCVFIDHRVVSGLPISCTCGRKRARSAPSETDSTTAATFVPPNQFVTV